MLTVVPLLLAFQEAQASVVGKWKVTGEGSMSYEIDGYPPETDNYKIKDSLRFKANHVFVSKMWRGKWTQKGSGFALDIRRSVKKFVKDYFADFGIKASLEITSYKFTGSSTSSKISGAAVIEGIIHVTHPRKLNAWFSMEESFSGSKARGMTGQADSEPEVELDEEEQSELFGQVLNRMLQVLDVLESSR
jgi:hypothetical protein